MPLQKSKFKLIKSRKDILMNVIQCIQILLEEMTGELDVTLNNTAARLKELDSDDEKDQAKLWEYRDNILAIWEEPAIQVGRQDSN